MKTSHIRHALGLSFAIATAKLHHLSGLDATALVAAVPPVARAVEVAAA